MNTAFADHNNPAFTREELAQLMRDDRILALVAGPADAAGFDYLVCESGRPRGIKGTPVFAWRINARGEKDSAQLAPELVEGDQFCVLDLADPGLRRAFTDYVWNKPKTFLFSHRQGGEVRALGVGFDFDEACDDAVLRLKKRYPTGDMPPQMKSLHGQLLARVAYVIEQRRGGFLTQEEMGHEYMSNETMLVAQALSSNYDNCESYLKNCVRGGQAVSDVFRREVSRIEPGIDLGLVDWSEVAGSFPDAIALREARTDGGSLDAQAEGRQSSAVAVDGRAVDPDVLDVLRSAVAEGNLVRLPPARLDPKLYKRVNAVLEALGGKWVGRKVQAHQFEVDAQAVLDVVATTGRYVRPQDFGFFPTPADLVDQVVELAEIEPGMKVLEPSAGHGAIAKAMAQAAGGHEQVTVVELLPGNARKLREAGFSGVVEQDFLSLVPNPVYERIVMNPPFNGGIDVDHVMHAARFLRPDGKLVAITSIGWGQNSGRKAQAFRDFVQECEGEVQEVPAGAFKEAGTNVPTRIVTFCAENFPWHREAENSLRDRQRA